MSDPVAPRLWAIIPARGGSRGIPRKNLQQVGGRSLIGRAVETARACNLIERTIVSSDDPDILMEAESWGAESIVRPANLSGDTASSEVALLHALDKLESEGKSLPDIVALIQCTSPFLSVEDIQGTVAAMIEHRADVAFTVTPSHAFHWRIAPDSTVTPIGHDSARRPMRQERDADCRETGGIYVMRVAEFRQKRHRFFGKTVGHRIAPLHALEIDEPDDLHLARALAPLKDIESRRSLLPKPIGAIVFDFDGVLTDNRVLQHEDGKEIVICDRADGLGIEMLRDAGLRMIVLSRERNPVVAARCRKLGIDIRQGVDDKLTALNDIVEHVGTDLCHTIYVGNDLNDLECLRAAGLGVVVADAHSSLRFAAGLVLSRPGGRGAVRELAEIILAERLNEAGSA